MSQLAGSYGNKSPSRGLVVGGLQIKNIVAQWRWSGSTRFANANLLHAAGEFDSLSEIIFLSGARMHYDPLRHHRRSIRLKGWDYANAGWYYVTIVVKDRQCVFGRVVNGVMEHSPLGLIADEFWREIPHHHPGVSLDEHIVMPNHVHGIVVINEKRQGDVDVRGRDVQGAGTTRRDVQGAGTTRRDVQLNVPTRDTIALNVPTRNTGAMNVPTRDTIALDVRTGNINSTNIPTTDTNASNVPTGNSDETDAVNIPSGNTDAMNVPLDDPGRRNGPGAGEIHNSTDTIKGMSPAKGSLSVIIRTFKAAVTTWAHGNGYGGFEWLGRFHDHIIRNEQELKRIREYIRNNPRNWALDNENPGNDPQKSCKTPPASDLKKDIP